MTRLPPSIILVLLLLAVPFVTRAEDKLVITRPGQTLLPENSLAALTVAIIQQADTIQIDAVLNGDDEVIVLSDPIINDITDVAEHYPERVRPDGNFYVFDFSSTELRQLSLTTQADYQEIGPGLPSAPLPRFQIASLQDVLALIRLQEKSLGRRIGVAVELKKGWLHQTNEKDLSRQTIEVLKRYGYTTPGSGCYLGSYDSRELKRIHDELFAAAELELPLIQLITDNDSGAHMTEGHGRFRPYNYDWMFTRFGLKGISGYADIIGIKPDVLTDATGAEAHSGYLADARLLGLKVLAYPLDLSVQGRPGFAADSDALLDHYLFDLGLDGLLTPQGPLVRSYLDKPAETDDISTQQQSIERLIENAEKNKIPRESLFLK